MRARLSATLIGLLSFVTSCQVPDAIDRAAAETRQILDEYEHSGESAPVLAWLADYHGEAPSHQVIITTMKWATRNSEEFESLMTHLDEGQRTLFVRRAGFALSDGGLGEEFARSFEASQHPVVKDIVEHYEQLLERDPPN